MKENKKYIILTFVFLAFWFLKKDHTDKVSVREIIFDQINSEFVIPDLAVQLSELKRRKRYNVSSYKSNINYRFDIIPDIIDSKKITRNKLILTLSYTPKIKDLVYTTHRIYPSIDEYNQAYSDELQKKTKECAIYDKDDFDKKTRCIGWSRRYNADKNEKIIDEKFQRVILKKGKPFKRVKLEVTIKNGKLVY